MKMASRAGRHAADKRGSAQAERAARRLSAPRANGCNHAQTAHNVSATQARFA
jgi:hypothetical protein